MNRSFRSNPVWLSLAAVSATLGQAHASDPQSVTLVAVADASISEDRPNEFFGSNPSLVVGDFDGGEWHSLVRWDIQGSIPEGAEILDVSIQLTMPCLSGTTSIFMSIDKIDESWLEGLVNWNLGIGSSPLTGTYPITDCTGQPNQLVTLLDDGTLRDWVDDIVNDNENDDGLLFRASPPINGAYQLFDAKEASASNAPRLVIEYKVAPDDEIDVAVDSVSVGPGPIGLCGDVEITYTLTNHGSATATGLTATPFVSTIPDQCSGTQLCNFFSIDDIAPGETITRTRTCSILGTVNRQDYHVILSVSAPDDIDTGNNCNDTPGKIAFQTCPELRVMSVQVEGDTFAPGDTIDVDYIIENLGEMDSEPASVSLTLSPFNIPGAPECSWGPYALGTVDGFGENASSESLALCTDLPDGDYYVCATVLDGSSTLNFGCTQGTISVASASPCNAADVAEPYGVLDFDDVLAFLSDFPSCSELSDIAPTFGVCDFDDVLEFLTAFGAGCP